VSLVTAISEILAPVRDGLTAVEVRLRQVAAGQHQALTMATERLLDAGGKRIRPAISLLTAGLFAAPTPQAIALAAAIEMLHTATLVHDDLIDGALLRRGVPTLNANWLPNATVLTGDYLFARAASMVAETNSSHIHQLFAQTLMTIVNGEIRQQFSSRGLVSRTDYQERIYAKTGALFVLATEAAAVLGEADPQSLEAVRSFGREVGVAYQIVDDILDFGNDPKKIGKPVGSDLRQGLVTLPTILYLQDHPNDTDVRATIQGNGVDPTVSERAVARVRTSGALVQAAAEARQYAERGRQALEHFGDSIYARTLATLSTYMVDRKL
jgi:geranylgeranyl pyrophosphate synthase